MNLRSVLVVTALAAPLVGCVQPQGHVEYVWTRTPGVVFVVVHPTKDEGKTYPVATNAGNDNPVDPRSDYVLLCDARHEDGMHCDVASEAGIRRFSYTQSGVSSAPAIDGNVGTIPDATRTERTTHETETAPAPPPPPASPPPPPPPPAPVAPAPAPGGKK
jgi:hypothetical protein